MNGRPLKTNMVFIRRSLPLLGAYLVGLIFILLHTGYDYLDYLDDNKALLADVILVFLLFTVLAWVIDYFQEQVRQDADENVNRSKRMYAAMAQAVLDAPNLAVLGWNDQGKIEFANLCYLQMLGKEPEQIIGVSWGEALLPNEKYPDVARELARIDWQELGQNTLELPLIDKQGDERYLSWKIMPAEVPGTTLKRIAFGSDVTNLRNEQRKSRELLDFNNRMMNASPTGLAAYSSIGQCVWANEALAEMSGITVEEACKQNFHEIKSWHDSDLRKTALLVLATGESGEHTFSFVNSLGRKLWVHITLSRFYSGGSPHVLLVMVDETDRIAGEHKLREARDRLAVAASAGGMGIWDWDLENLSIQLDNRASELLVMPNNVHLNDFTSSLAYLDKQDGPRLKTEFDRAILEGSELQTCFKLHLSSGDTRDIQLSAAIHRNQEGKAQRMIGIVRDISEMVANEKELRQSKEAAEQANLAKSQFLASVSHEIRTPINAVLGLSHLLKRTNLSSLQQSYIEKVQSAGNSLLSVINEVLDFSKIEAGKCELEIGRFSLGRLINELEGISDGAITNDNITLFEVEPEVPECLIGDFAKLKQVLVNLLSNALKFTKSGTVEVKIALENKSDYFAELRFSVRDTGIGIHPEVIKKLFKPFEQGDPSTNRNFGGTGLGLAICRHLVDLMGGHISVQSSEGVGSEFSFALILGFENCSTSLVAEETTPKALIVDDNHIACKVNQRILDSLGFKAAWVTTGTEALEELTRACVQRDPYHLVVLDYLMPGMDGLELAQRIKSGKFCREVPKILMLAANSLPSDKKGTQGQNIDAMIDKPVDPDELCELLTSLGLLNRQRRCTVSGQRLDGVKILLVEDNEVNQIVGSEMLRFEGAEVTIASNGAAAVGLVDSGSGFDLVLLDLHMPGMDGFETSLELKRIAPHLPIIALTADVVVETMERCLEGGMSDYLSKPFNPEQLVSVVKRWVQPADTERKSPAAKDTGRGTASELEGTAERKHEEDESSENYLAPSSEDSSPKIEGLDTARVMRVVQNNRSLLKSLLESFVQNEKSFLDKVHIHLEQGDYLKAFYLVHSLKGSSGSLGAQDVYEKCKVLDVLLKQDPPNPERVERGYDELKTSLRKLLDSIQSFLQADSRSSSSNTSNKDQVSSSVF